MCIHAANITPSLDIARRVLYTITMPETVPQQVYTVIPTLIYIAIAVIFLFALFFGLRAKRNVKHEKVTSLPDGLSPLDVQRIFKGKTDPRRITAALLTYWAKRGYIKLTYIDKRHVHVTKIAPMPPHTSPNAKFYDRGTYVRERKLFSSRTDAIKNDGVVATDKPLFDKLDVIRTNAHYAVREDEGVFPSLHYSLKIFIMIFSVVPFALLALMVSLASGNFVGFVLVGTGIIGMSVLIFAKGMPILFKTLWCGMWLGASIGGLLSFAIGLDAPAYATGAAWAASITLLLGPTVLRQFVDYRDKKNLADYSDLVNYRKFLLFASADELRSQNYAEVLPYLHVFGIKPFAAHKYDRTLPSDMYDGDFQTGGLV